MEVSKGLIAADKAINTLRGREVCFPLGNFLFDCLKMRRLHRDSGGFTWRGDRKTLWALNENLTASWRG